MRTGVVLLNFGEPEHATEAEVVPFLERIFATNASLEEDATPEQARARSAELARRRAPGLIEEYRHIGGSPLNAQAAAQAQALASELQRRGHDVRTFVGMQFTDPSIEDAVARAHAEGAERIVALPIYPLCGPSTTVAALAKLKSAVVASGWEVPVLEIGGWHVHDWYIHLRAEGVRRIVRDNALRLGDSAALVFSAHGTPVKYLREGSRYDLYVRDCCARVARAADAPSYVIGYQNHTNRRVEWTQPEIEEVIEALPTQAAVVVPISFMHEQSETLAELDVELRQKAEARGLRFLRVPVPHDDPAFAVVLADLVERRLADEMLDCRCRAGAACLTAAVGAASPTG